MAVEKYAILVAVIVIGFAASVPVRPSFATKALRQLPAASIFAPFTAIWLVYHNRHGRRYLIVEEAHRKRGSVIRISPYHVSFSSSQAYKDIYGHGVPVLKDAFYDNLAGSTPSMADTSSRELHLAKRRNLAAIFSAKNITAMEPKAQHAVSDLINAITLKSQGKPVSPVDRYPIRDVYTGEFDLRPWLNMFSFDAFSDMLWSDSFGFLKTGNDECLAMRSDYKTVDTVHAMHSFQTGVHFNTICAQFGSTAYRVLRRAGQILRMESRRNADHFAGMVRHRSMRRLKVQRLPDEVDFFSFMPTQASPKVLAPMSIPDIVAECTSFLNAGNDTTQMTLTNTVFELAANPEKQQTLQDILRKTLPDTRQPIASYSELQHIPYLRACLDESLRLRPPVRFGLPRRTTGKGTMIAGHFIPGNVTVSSSLHTLHHDATLFHSPLEYLPERWIPGHPDSSDSERQNLKDFVLPFTMGPRACIGRNLAYMELSICLAALVMSFEFAVSNEPRQNFTHFERFNCSPTELLVKVKARAG